MKGQITKNVASNYALSAVQMALGILLIPFLIKKLGKEVFGIAILSESIIAFVEVGIASFRIALSRYVTFALAQNNQQDFIEYISSGRYILFLASLIVLVLGLTLSLFFPAIFRVPPGQELQSKMLFALITIAIVITIPNVIYWSILYAKQRLDLINLSSSLGVILRAAAIFVLFSFLPTKCVSLATYGIIYLFIRWAQNYFVYIWHKKILPGIKPEFRFFKWDKVVEVMSFSIHTSLGSVSTTIYENMANVLVNIFYGPAANSLYAVSLKIPATIKSLFLQATWALTPTFIDLAAKDDRRRLTTLFFMYSKAVAVISIPVVLLLIVFAHPIITCWVGDSFTVAADLLPIHILPLLITIPFAATNCVNTANAKVKVPNAVMFIAAIVNVALGILLAKTFHLDLFGFAAATTLCVIISNGLFTPYYACRVSKLDYRQLWGDAFCKPFVWSLLIVISFVLLIQLSWGKSFITTASGSLFVIFVYILGCFKWVLNHDEVEYISSFLTRIGNKMRGTKWQESGY